MSLYLGRVAKALLRVCRVWLKHCTQDGTAVGAVGAAAGARCSKAGEHKCLLAIYMQLYQASSCSTAAGVTELLVLS